MTPTPPRRVALSSWAVHDWLGYTLADTPGDAQVDVSRLLELPAAASAQGIKTLEVCHFHLPRHNPALLSAFCENASSEGVQLFSLLIDDGDLAHPQHHRRDREWTLGWMKVAAGLNFERVRVIAGKQAPTSKSLARSCENLAQLAEQAGEMGLRLTTENWHKLFSHPEPLLWMFEKLGGRLGLCLDFGNWHGQSRYVDLKQIAHLAESCHAKCGFDANGTPELEEFETCLNIMRSTGFAGPFTLVQGVKPGEWESLALQQAALGAYL